MNSELLRCYVEHVEQYQRDRGKPSIWANSRVIKREPIDIGSYKPEPPEYHTPTVCVLGDGKYIGFMAYKEDKLEVQNPYHRLRGRYRIWDVEKKEFVSQMDETMYYAARLGDKWIAHIHDPDNGGSLTIYNYLTGQHTIDMSEGAPLHYEILNFGNRYIITAGGAISCHDLETGNELFRVHNDDCNYIRNLQFRENGQVQATIEDNVVVYNLHDLSVAEEREAEQSELEHQCHENDQFGGFLDVPYPPYHVDELNGCRYIIEDGTLFKETFQDDGMLIKLKLFKNMSLRDVDIVLSNGSVSVERKAKRPRYE